MAVPMAPVPSNATFTSPPPVAERPVRADTHARAERYIRVIQHVQP
jgi:hypothetical protein